MRRRSMTYWCPLIGSYRLAFGPRRPLALVARRLIQTLKRAATYRDHRQVTEAKLRVWHRAAVDSGGPTPREGDKALAAVLEAHGYVMNGGVFHAVECLGPERLRLCCEGYIYFGLREIASVFEAAAEAEETDETEDVFNSAYGAHAQDDQVIVERFERDITAHPERYAP
jgi:hypothetical protein